MSMELTTPTDVQKEQAGRFKARRLALNLSQKGLSARSGVTAKSTREIANRIRVG